MFAQDPKGSIAFATLEDPFQDTTRHIKRNSLFVAGLAILHYHNSIELTEFGFKLQKSSPEVIALILLLLLTYLSITLVAAIYSDMVLSLEKINLSEIKERHSFWGPPASQLENINKLLPAFLEKAENKDMEKSIVANLNAIEKYIPVALKREEELKISVARAKTARRWKTLITDIILPCGIIIVAFYGLIVMLLDQFC